MAKVYSTTIVEHSVGLIATLHVTVPNGTATSVVATKDGETVYLVYDSAHGYWKANLSNTGLWTITATDGTDFGSATVNVDYIGMYVVQVSLEIYYVSATVVGETATSVTATKDQETINLTYNSASDTWGAKLSGTGTWTLTATNGTYDASTTISVTNIGTYDVVITFVIGTLQITVSNGTASSVTATQGSTVVNLSYVSSKWTAVVGAGTWTIKATKSGGYTKSGTITVSATQTYTLTLTFNNLPDAYTQRNYITSNSTEMSPIEVGMDTYPIGSQRIQGKLRITNDLYGTKIYLVAKTSKGLYGILLDQYYTPVRIRYYNDSTVWRNTPTDRENHSYVDCVQKPINIDISYNMRNNSIVMNGTTYTISSSSYSPMTESSGGNLRLSVAAMRDTYGYWFTNIYQYATSVWNTADTAKIANYIPATRNSDGVWGFYNTVNGGFITKYYNNVSLLTGG